MAVHLDVRTKIIMLVFVNALLLINLPSLYEWLLVLGLCSWFLSESDFKRASRYLALFSCLFFLEGYVILHGDTTSYLAMLAVGGRLLLPCFMIGGSILRGSVHEFIVTMRKWRVPEGLLIAAAVMIRFLPTLKADYITIRDGLKTRGLFLNNWLIIIKPLTFFEYVTVPLLMNATRTAQNLTIASMTKAVASKTPKTSYIDYRLGYADFAVYLYMVIFAVALFLGVGL